MKEIKIDVYGMTCEHCVARVNKFIKEIGGVQNIKTVLKENMSYILANNNVGTDAIKTAVENAGYKAGKSEVTEKTDAPGKPKNSYGYDLVIIGGGSAAFSSAIYAAEKDTGRVLGIHILAHNSSETIQQASLYLQNNYTVERIGGEIGVYPTMAEALKLCAQTFTKDISKLSCCA